MSATRTLVFALLEDERDLGLLAIAGAIGDVLALSCAPPTEATRVDGLLARAASLGAGRTARILDPVLAGVDYLAVAHVLACAIRHLSEATPDTPILVLAGDRGRGAVGPAVAERLAVPHLGAVHRLVLEEDCLLVDRLCGAELRRYVGATPAVLNCVLPSPPVTPEMAVSPPPPIALTLETLQITAQELQYRRRFRPAGGVGPTARPQVLSNVELLGERLVRDGLWPVPHDDTAAQAERSEG